ncbi:hypothetical protein [Priestia abyssalis]|nr:hypothetical protein [Priestia abyssalis]
MPKTNRLKGKNVKSDHRTVRRKVHPLDTKEIGKDVIRGYITFTLREKVI